MKILLIGGSGSLINSLIVRMKKEGERVFLLTGSRYKHEEYERVFERYDFPYDTKELGEVFESVDPDVTLFMGAFDPCYDWNGHESRVGVRFVSDFINILMAFATRRRGRFIYLSSEDVFEATDDDEAADEDRLTDSASEKGMALAQAEMLCSDYRERTGLDYIILRIGGLYLFPGDVSDVKDPVTRMCLEAVSGIELTSHRNRRLAPLSGADAVQFITQVVLSEKNAYGLYNISSDSKLTEEEAAQLVIRCSGEKNSYKAVDSGSGHAVLSNQRYRNEFGINRFSDLESDIMRICGYMSEHRDKFLPDSREKSLRERLMARAGWLLESIVPYAENIFLFFPVYWLSTHASGSSFFARIDFYLLYVILFAVVHGQQQAVLSALLSTAGYIAGRMAGQSGLDVVADYNTYVWIAQLFVVGLIVGYMHDRIDKSNREAEEDHAYMSTQLLDMRDINDSELRVKNALETQVITQEDPVGKVYEIVSGLDQYSSDEVLFYAARVVQDLMHAKDVTIYISTAGAFARLFTATTKKARTLGNSIRFENLGILYETVLQHRVFINRSLDQNLPMMASAIYEDNGLEDARISTIVMVWELPWERLTLSQANLMAVICSLIRDAVSRASRYLKAIEANRFISGTNVFAPEEFARVLRVHLRAQSQGLTEVALLHVIRGEANLQDTARMVSSGTRETDYVGALGDGELYILLANTDEYGASIAAQRMESKGIHVELSQFPDIAI